jgi:hypothetical protein
MSETIIGANSINRNAAFNVSSDPSYYEADGEGQQIYLDSVLPHEYDPTLEPFDTTGIRPKKYPEQTKEGFHPKEPNRLQYTYDNTDVYFQPQNRPLRYQ